MPAQWTADLVGKMHLHKIKVKALAEKVNWNEKYLSTVLNSENPPRKAESKLNAALDEMIAEKN